MTWTCQHYHRAQLSLNDSKLGLPYMHHLSLKTSGATIHAGHGGSFLSVLLKLFIMYPTITIAMRGTRKILDRDAHLK